MRIVIARLLCGTIAAAALSWSVGAQQPASPQVTPQVTPQDLRDGLKNPTRWLTYSGNYANHRHSPLTQITPAHVNRLVAQWPSQPAALGKFEASPLAGDGVLYVTGPLDTAWAIDPRTGRQI